ncbi:peptidoglycan editing factor PgeF [Dyadobacter sp. Leaf189]|uniref:peptidoglycan editing factor PgeF n=1 Tax=Dyadobacter sp. Leaf189 TaxID=1736295 RepID=UPI0006F2CCFB|nr:peptidoglycan editing factor PgeF [Dyadobacter sp. Leaf189]KQS33449.1 polyphenol oxidoreductase [Dyadobacter sp. Leaf189]
MNESTQSETKPLFRIPAIFSQFTNVVAAESTRHGGVSPAPFHSLNLGGTQDSYENVLENNKLFFEALHIPFVTVAKSHQVHGTEILNVTEPGRFEGYDALITQIKGIQLAVTVADCTPILILDPRGNAAAAIHAGWRGTVGKIVAKTVLKMQELYGSKPENCLAYIGTCIDECSFEVGEDVAQHFDDTCKRWDDEKRKFFVDLKKSNQAQLLEVGLPAENIEISPYSTVLNNEDYFSYRNENGVTGRMLATIGFTTGELK